MKFLSVAILSLAGLAMAKGHEKAANGTATGHHGKGGHNGTHNQSTMAQCREVARLTNLMDLANNQTRLDKVTHSNATKEEAIKSKASAEASTLSALQANATLMATCNQVFAVDAMRESCAKMNAMERLETLVANATRLADVTKNNATKAAELQAKASADASKLSSLQGNSTLTQFCSVETTKAKCEVMKSLQKMVNEAANSTWLEAHFKGNETKITAFKNRAAKEQTKLTALQGNSTLTSACSALGVKSTTDTAAAAAASGSATSSSTTSSSSSSSSSAVATGAGSSVQPFATVTSLAALLIAGVLLL